MIAILVCAANAVYVAHETLFPPIRTVSIQELIRNRAAYTGRQVRVEGGTIARGTLMRTESCVYRFLLESQGATIPVRLARCVPSNTFRHDLHFDFQVTPQGELMADGHFEAENLLMRYGGPFQLKKPERDPRSELPDWVTNAGGDAP